MKDIYSQWHTQIPQQVKYPLQLLTARDKNPHTRSLTTLVIKIKIAPKNLYKKFKKMREKI